MAQPPLKKSKSPELLATNQEMIQVVKIILIENLLTTTRPIILGQGKVRILSLVIYKLLVVICEING